MNITENRINSNKHILPESVSYFSGLNAAVIDIETTGLSPARDIVFLVGILSSDANGLKVTQFLASNYEEEAAVLSAVFGFVKTFDILFNYNGTSFDIPFINKRSAKLGLNRSIDLCRSVDYLRIFKASYLPKLLSDMKLKTVEKYAGVFRADTISGKECISLYSDFVNKNDRQAAKKILLHNFEDLSCFPELNKLIAKIDIHAALSKTGFPVKSGANTFFIQNIKAEASSLKITGYVPDCNISWAFYEDGFTLLSDSAGKTFELEIFDSPLSPDDCSDARTVNSYVTAAIANLKL